MVVSILPATFWRQQISWSYSIVPAVVDDAVLLWHDAKVTLSRKRCPARGVIWLGVTAAILMVCGSTFALPTFFCFFLCFLLGFT